MPFTIPTSNRRAALAAVRGAGLIALLVPALAFAQRPTPRTQPRRPAAQPAATAPAPTAAAADTTARFATVRGMVNDSLHDNGALVGAIVRLRDNGQETRTNAQGLFEIDSVPPGHHELVVLHPLLDTLGIGIGMPDMQLAPGQIVMIDLSLPSQESVVSLFCPPARRTLGPGALVGFVRDADSEAPAVGARVSLVWYEVDVSGLRRVPRVREATVTADGRYRLCGLPPEMSGKVQVIRGRVTTGEVPVDIGKGILGMRSLSIAGSEAMIAVARPSTDTSSGRAAATVARPSQVRRGRGRITGHVVDRTGQPLSGAQVSLQGVDLVATTRADGLFTLDSLPIGTQTIEVRRLGYAMVEQGIDISAVAPSQVTVVLQQQAVTLESMRVQADRDNGLMAVGFTQRQRQSNGWFLTGAAITDREASRTSDVLRAAPALRIMTAQDGANWIASTRDPTNGCMRFWVDGAERKQEQPGDIDDMVHPTEVVAVEVYTPATVPLQFQGEGGNCTTVVVWTKARVFRR